MFLTYSSLTSSSDKGDTRLQQLVDWAGPAFDGLIIFDECHKAKNLVPEAGSKSTKVTPPPPSPPLWTSAPQPSSPPQAKASVLFAGLLLSPCSTGGHVLIFFPVESVRGAALDVSLV